MATFPGCFLLALATWPSIASGAGCPFSWELQKPFWDTCNNASTGNDNATNLADTKRNQAAAAQEKSNRAGDLADQLERDRTNAQNTLGAASGDSVRQAQLSAQPYAPAGISPDVAKYVQQTGGVRTIGDLAGTTGSNFIKTVRDQQQDLLKQTQDFTDQANQAAAVATQLAQNASAAVTRGLNMGSVDKARVAVHSATARENGPGELLKAETSAAAGVTPGVKPISIGSGSSAEAPSGISSRSSVGSSAKKSADLKAAETSKLEKLKDPATPPSLDKELKNPFALLDALGAANANPKPLDVLAAGGYVSAGKGSAPTPDQEINQLDQMLQTAPEGSLGREPAAMRSIFEIVSRQYRKRFPMFDGRLVSSVPNP